MKKRFTGFLILSSLGSMVPISALAQDSIASCCCDPGVEDICGHKPDKVTEVLLDFKTKRLVLPKENYRFGRKSKSTQLVTGSSFQVRVIHYNPFLYKVAINNSDSTASVPTDGKFMAFFLDPSNISTVVAGLISNIAAAPVPVTLPMVGALKAMKGIQANRNPLMQSVGINPQLKKGETPKEHVLEIQSKERGIVEVYIDEVRLLRAAIEEKLFDLNRRLSVVWKLVPECNDFKRASETESLQGELLALLEDLYSQKVSLRNALDQYLVRTSLHRTLVKKDASLNFADSLINSSYSMLLQDIDKIEAAFSFKTVEGVIRQFENLTQASSCYKSLPIYMQKDIGRIKIALDPFSDSTGLQPYSTEFFLPWMQRRIWGLSGGIYFSSLHNQAYAVQSRVASATGDTTFTIIEDDGGSGEFGINALAYTAWRLSARSNSYLGASFGAGLSLEPKPKPRAFLGISLVNGEKNRLVVSLGAVGGFVNTVSKAFDTKINYGAQPSNFLRDKLKTRAFVSLNYSFL